MKKLLIVFAGVVALLWSVWAAAGAKLLGATAIGLVAGFALYHAAFGFTAQWRAFLTEGLGQGLRMQLVLIGLVAIFAFPLIGYGEALGLSVRGSVAPLSVGVVVGAFMFGFGMMFAGGCGSGTLFTVGGGSTRMLFTLSAFIAGSVIGLLHVPWWRDLPAAPRFGLVQEFGPVAGFAVLLALLAAIWFYSRAREIRLHGAVQAPRETGSFLLGPWSLWLGVVAIAFVSVATLALLGRPWGITSGFTLWGAKVASIAGADVANWPNCSACEGLLTRPVLGDATSVMNFGIIGGAMLAATLAGRFAPKWRLTPSDVGTAVFGGLLMGYGARIAYGCNIGAYLGGSISGSAHGLLWMIAALIGSAAALKLRTGKGFVV